MGWKTLPRPDALELTRTDSGIVLLTDDGTPRTEAAAGRLQQQGFSVLTLYLPGSSSGRRSEAGPVVRLDAVSDAAIEAMIQDVIRRYGPIGAFIHLHPPFADTDAAGFRHYQAEMETMKAVFLLAKHLGRPLKQFAAQGRPAFLCVASINGRLGTGDNEGRSVLGGGLNGLVKTLRLEWPQVFCRIVDIHPQLSSALASDILLAELLDPDRRLAETGWTQAGRATPVLVSTDLAGSIQSSISPSDVFVVSGGARGVTAACVVEMARRFHCRFILLGRSAVDFALPDYAKGEIEDGELNKKIMEDLKARGEAPTPVKVRRINSRIASKKEIERTLNSIAAAGGQALYLPVDVTDPAELAEKLADAAQRLGAINGLVHGAGVLADKWIEQKTEEDFDQVLGVKVGGLKNLLEQLSPAGLKTIVLFSSIAGYYGNKGQSDYAMANEILNKLAHQFKAQFPDLLVKAIDWGAWESGMVSPELKKRFEEAGVALIPVEEGAKLLVHELGRAWQDEPQAVIGKELAPFVSETTEPLRTYSLERILKPEDNPFLQHHRIHGQAVLPIVNGIGWIINGAEQLYPDFRVVEATDAAVFKGIVFDGHQPETFVLEIVETEKNAQTITLTAEVRSQGGKLPLRHYRANLRLQPKSQPVTQPLWTTPVPSGTDFEDGGKLYTDGSLFHGPHFQGIEKILACDESGLLLACRVPEIPEKDQGQFPIQDTHPFFADIQYQGMVVWVDRTYQAKSLPARTDRVRFYREIRAGQELLVRVDIREHSDFKMAADCTVFDREGRIYMKTEGAKVTVSKQLQW